MDERTTSAGLPAATRAEEWANSITHGIGLVLSVIGFFVLVRVVGGEGEVSRLVGCCIFGVTLVFMYAASTLYHSFRTPRLKRLLRLIDHSAIFVFIAGSYTPFVLLYFDGGLAWTLLCLEWGAALAGIVYKFLYLGRSPLLSMLLYLAMGLLVVTVAQPLLRAAPPGCVAWIAAGGLCYTGGIAFFVWHRLPYHHAIWHVFVLAGSLCHYLALALYL